MYNNNPAPKELLNSNRNLREKIYEAIYLGTLNKFKAADRIIYLAKEKKMNILRFSIYGKETRKSLFKNNELSRSYLNSLIKDYNLEDKDYTKK